MSDPRSNSNSKTKTPAPRTPASKTPASKTPTSRTPVSRTWRTPSKTPAAPDDIIFLETPFGNAYEVTLDYFADTVLPPLHPNIDPKKRLLETTLHSQQLVTGDQKWWGYKDKTPGACENDFNKSYSSLSRGIRKLVKDTKGVTPALVFHVNKEGEPLFDDRTVESLPDAFFLMTPVAQDSFSWEDVAVIGELERFEENDDVLEVARKMVGSMSQCLHADPRRRFVYGFTVENARTRLWYGDRSIVLATEPFNFIYEHSRLFTFVLRVSFAEPHQLGWDPTIRRIETMGQVQYEIAVQPSDGDSLTYRTLAVLSDTGAERLLSRGTRVWTAVRVVNGEEVGTPVALKDAWVDNSREREGDVHCRLFHSDYFLKEHPELQDCFIAIQNHGDVVSSGSSDCAPCFLARGPSRSLPFNYAGHQMHYRVVYTEIGEPLRNITSLHVVFQALVDALKGLSAMHAAGWVHRDLSAGNILVVDGGGKIHDLEFATNDTHPGKIGRTGTADFVAVEVDQQRYLFPPPPPDYPKPLSPPSGSESSGSPESSESSDGLPPLPPPTGERYTLPEFRYNSLHDLESLWWNAVYFTVNREVDDSADESLSTDPDRRLAQRLAAGQLFYQKHYRFSAIYEGDGFAHSVECLHPVLNGIANILEEVRLSLRHAYALAGSSVPDMDPKIANDLADRMRVQFQRAAIILKERKVIVRRFAPS